jgi:Domain of unknown function (DUF4188)
MRSVSSRTARASALEPNSITDAANAALASQAPGRRALSCGLAWIKGPAVVQYWRSFEDLDRFARAADDPHPPAWRRFNRTVRATGDMGI